MNSRLETFCDGVFAIAITLLILDIKVPPVGSVHSVAEAWRDVGDLWPSFFALSLSFILIFISWVGHHNYLKVIDKSSPQFLFANGFFLFTIIFIPFPTSFMAEYLNTPYAQPAIVLYCLNTVLNNIGWNALHLTALHPKPLLKSSVSLETIKSVGRSSRIGLGANVAIAVLAWWLPYVALAISVSEWVFWTYLALAVKSKES